MTASMGLVRLVTYLNNASLDTYIGRMAEARAALPRIAQEEAEVVIFFGSSMVQTDISPRQFDEELSRKGIDVKSFNFGFGGLNPLFQEYLSRRINDSFLENEKRIALSLIEFNPFQATLVQRKRGDSLEDSLIPFLASDSELRDLLLDDPKRGIRLFVIRYLRGSVSAEMLTSFLARGLRPRQYSDLVEDPEIIEKRRLLRRELPKQFAIDFPGREKTDWAYDWQGGYSLPQERSAASMELYRQYFETKLSKKLLENDLFVRVKTADIVGLHLDDELVSAFIRVVENLRDVSDRVDIALLPRNTDWIVYPPDAQARLDHAINRIENETGITVQNYQEIDSITPRLFDDTTHLASYTGRVVFTHFLADRYAPRLQR
jgi:hypothetical protein